MQQVAEKFDRLGKKFRPYVPFTVLNTVIRNLDKGGRNILDVGCGSGETMKNINKKEKWLTTGVDIYEPSLLKAQASKTHNNYILCDITNISLPPKSFDIVLCLEVLEHLEREEGFKLLKKLEEIAIRQVVISTPQGRYDQHTVDGNIHQTHKATWTAGELKKLGYKVRGHGISGIGGEQGLAARLPGPLVPLANMFYVMVGPLVYLFPKFAGALVCIKNIDSTINS